MFFLEWHVGNFSNVVGFLEEYGSMHAAGELADALMGTLLAIADFAAPVDGHLIKHMSWRTEDTCRGLY